MLAMIIIPDMKSYIQALLVCFFLPAFGPGHLLKLTAHAV